MKHGKTCILLAALLLIGCDESGSTTEEDTATTSDAVADATTDATADAATDTTADSGGEDTAVDTAEPPPILDEPKARVYIHDPVTDNGELTEVTLPKVDTEDGSLINAFATPYNCLNEEGGTPLSFGGFDVGSLCLESHTVFPDPDGNYFSTAPPDDSSDPDDPFAELMMYYHVNETHRFFKERGIDNLDISLEALANVNLYINELAASFLGTQPGWQPFPNAAFIPEEGFEQFQLPPRENGAIVFGQYNAVDFSYDATVITHEYAHFFVGTERLQGVLYDRYGMDNFPGAINEGIADYFAATRLDSPVIGAHALAALGGHLKRDLSVPRKCPDNVTTGIHADGRIIGSMLWSLRESLGAEVTDDLLLKAMATFTLSTSFNGVANALIAEAELVSPEVKAEVERITTEHGVLDCERAREWVNVNFGAIDAKQNLTFLGTGNQIPNFSSFVPGYLQFYAQPQADTVGVTLSWRVTAGQQGGFGGGSPGPLDLALRKQQPVRVGLGTITADAELTGLTFTEATSQSVTLSGNCLDGESPVYIAMINRQQGGAEVDIMSIDYLTDLTGAPNVVTCD